MKNTLLFICLLAMSIQISAQTPSVKSDEDAIKKVITDESTAWANRDTVAYFAAYADNELTQGAYNNRNLSIGTYSGLEAIKKSVRDGIKANPNKFYQPNIERTDWLIKLLSPEWAWVNFTQKTANVRGQVNTSYETRLMHKEGGKWKINVVNALWDYKNVVQPAVNPDEEDIKKVIVNETEMFLNQNKPAWAESFIHEPYLTWTVTNGGDPGDGLTTRGWDALNTYMDTWFGNDMSALVKQWRKEKTTRDQWQIQIRGNVAYVSYNQHSEGEKQKMDSTETRVLEKINGAWKIAMQATVADFKDATPPIKSKY
jgi:ketosteroid isomerase-like protein